jgi:3-deoxy-7-phosphoheptulonate synthase
LRQAGRRGSLDSLGLREGTTVTPTEPVHNRRIAHVRALVGPGELRAQLPLLDDARAVVLRGRRDTTAILNGSDDRLLVVVGPCSIHDPKAGIDYAQRLAEVATRLRGDLLIVMCVYFEKPRTTVGWKGLINDPGLDASFRMNDGLRAARAFVLDVLAVGLPVGTEFLDPITPQYLADTVSWGAIGARTVQSQIHRQLASGLSMPVGFKNATTGDVQVAVDAVAAARGRAVFPGIGDDGRAAIFETAGNPDGHVVLRGGSAGPNCDADAVAAALERLRAAHLPECVVVDASHENSGKSHTRQAQVAEDLAERLARGERGVVGVMLESFLVSDRQELGTGELVYGQSVTDACIDWDTTEALLERFASAVARRAGTASGVDVDRERGHALERLQPLEEGEVDDGLGRGFERAAHRG